MSTYHYVIIGAGSAGCVIASRLSENPDAKVLLLEIGPSDSDSNITNPAGWPALFNSERDFAYHTIPQAHTAGRSHYWPRGRTVGGSSSLNGMIYVRGHRSDYDAWSYEGCIGWDYDSVLPYFKKSENFEGDASPYHGIGGPLNVSTVRNPNPVNAAAIEAATGVGFKRNDDCNGADILGVGYCQLTIKDGKRHSAASAFLVPAMDRPNLAVVTGAAVQKLLFMGNRCTGAAYVLNGKLLEVSAENETILCAGALATPQVLMLSGIGDAEELRKVGVPLRGHIPGVGKNLQDHLLCSLIFEAPKPIPAPQSNLLESQLFYKSDSRRLGPDIQPLFMHIPYYPSGFEGPSNAWTIAAGLIRPASRGSVRLLSSDPTAAPILDPQYLSESADAERLVDAVQMCLQIGHDHALDEWRLREVYPGPSRHTRSAVQEYVQRACGTYHHMVGTCKMGVDADSVVDPELRVYGIERLRIADASIMPTISSGNTNAPTIMIGEKAADLIAEAHSAHRS